MLSREGLWQRVAGQAFWGLPWALAAACSLPWILPEEWDGRFGPWGWRFGGAGLGLGLLLGVVWVWARNAGKKSGSVRWGWAIQRTRKLAESLFFGALFVFAVFLSLGRVAAWERALPLGWQEVEGRLVQPWTLKGHRRISRLQLTAPGVLKGLELPLSLPAEGTPGPPPGTPVRVRGELLGVEAAPAFLGERPLWRARSDGLPRRMHLRSAQLLEVLGPAHPSPLLRLETFVRERFEALPLQGAARDLWGALTLGLPPVQEDVFTPFSESGTIHTLVVSGLQVTLVMAALETLWRRLFRRGSTQASMIGGLLYAALVGFSAPVWRGLLMGLCWALSRRSGWKLPPVLTLHGALMGWMLLHPASGADPGFLLGWFALLGLLWGAPPLAGLGSVASPRLSRVGAAFLAPWLSTLPLLALLNGGAPLWGAVANLLVLPLVALLTPLCLGLTVLPLPGLVQAVGALLAWTGSTLVPPFGRIVPLATGLLLPWIVLLLGWVLLAQAHACLRRTRALMVALVTGSLLLIATRGTGRAAAVLGLEAPEVGQGDALLLRVPGGDATLVDAGPSPWSARRMARVLSRRGVREPIHLVLTHPHGDHAGGAATLARLWPFASLTLPPVARPELRWTPFLSPKILATARTAKRGDVWMRGGAEFSVRWPPKPFELPDPNLLSLVLRVRHGAHELWLMGDALAIQERDLLDLGDLGPGEEPRRHLLLKAGHHGGEGTCDPGFLKALDLDASDLVVFTAGRRNRFDFPTPSTLERVRAAGGPALALTGADGGDRVLAGPEGWLVERGR